MAIQKKTLTGAATSKVKDAGGRKPEASPEQSAKSSEVKRLTMAKLATAKLSTAKLQTLRRLH